MSGECYWWNSPFTLARNNRFLRFFPQSWTDFGSAEAVNRWSVYAVYIAVGAWLISGSAAPLVYAGAFVAGLYLYNTRVNRMPAGPCGAAQPPAEAKAKQAAWKNPLVPPPSNTRGAAEPSRNVPTYDERLTDGLMARGNEIPARPPIVAGKQRMVFARGMPMTGKEIPYSGIYDATHSDLRVRPVG